MEIHIKIQKSILKGNIEEYVEDILFSYNEEVVKLANVLSKEEMIRQLMQDEEFLKSIEKNYKANAEFFDVFYNAVRTSTCKTVKAYQAKLEKAEREYMASYEKQRKTEQAIAFLKQEGFTVNKS